MEGTLKGRRIVLCSGGMGKVNAAHAATILVIHYSPSAILLFGIGGAYPSSGANVGDVVIANEEIAGDEGVMTNDGFKDTRCIGIPLVKTASETIYNSYPATKELLDLAVRTLTGTGEGNRLQVGPFVTLSTCTGTTGRARELEERYHGICENMEGAAVAQIAMLHGIPWLEVRGISNIVEDRDLSKWNFPRAAHVAQRAVVNIVESWKTP